MLTSDQATDANIRSRDQATNLQAEMSHIAKGVFNQLSQPSNFFAPRMTKRGLEAWTRWLETLTLCLETLSPLKSCLNWKKRWNKLAKLQKLTWNSFICCLLLLYERTTNSMNNDSQWSLKLTIGHYSWDINVSEYSFSLSIKMWLCVMD